MQSSLHLVNCISVPLLQFLHATLQLPLVRLCLLPNVAFGAVAGGDLVESTDRGARRTTQNQHRNRNMTTCHSKAQKTNLSRDSKARTVCACVESAASSLRCAAASSRRSASMSSYTWWGTWPGFSPAPGMGCDPCCVFCCVLGCEGSSFVTWSSGSERPSASL